VHTVFHYSGGECYCLCRGVCEEEEGLSFNIVHNEDKSWIKSTPYPRTKIERKLAGCDSEQKRELLKLMIYFRALMPSAIVHSLGNG
jgi:hypothetical protein